MFARKAAVSLLSFGLMCAVGLVHCGGSGGGGSGSSGTGSGSTGTGSGSSGSSSSSTNTSSTTTNGTSGTTSAPCVEEKYTYGTDLPFSNDDSFTNKDCTSATAKYCPTGDCVEWEDKQGKHGKCFVYCSALQNAPSVGEACTSFSTCLKWKGVNACLPNSLDLCGASGSNQARARRRHRAQTRPPARRRQDQHRAVRPPARRRQDQPRVARPQARRRAVRPRMAVARVMARRAATTASAARTGATPTMSAVICSGHFTGGAE